ncbi:MAG: response regulator transcription factor, partial [Anaerolineales bacterium]
GYQVSTAQSGPEGLRQIEANLPHLLILDIMMPVMSGLEVCSRLRADEKYNLLPILFLSVRGNIDDVVAGLDRGGDDYIVKPFEITELNARVRALLRRAQRNVVGDQSILQVGDLELDSTAHTLNTPAQSVQLTTTEHRLLRYLMENAGQAMSPTHLLQAVWAYPPATGDPDLVRAHIRNLRAKIEQKSHTPQYILTVHGVGYKIYTPDE